MAMRGTRVWTDPQQLEDLIEEYFANLRVFVDEVETKPDGTQTVRKVELPQRPPTMAGLALALDVDRTTLINYNERDEFQPVLARAKARIAEWVESALFEREKSNGAKFALEVNHGYGREGTGNEGDEFHMNLIPPAEHRAALAIAKWEDDE